MPLTSNTHNKPVLPRTTDSSDLGSNRASIYSGKGLSFDGVNDWINLNSFVGIPKTNGAWSVAGYFKAVDNGSRGTWFSAHTSSGGNIIRVGIESGSTAGLFYADVYTADVQVSNINFQDSQWHFVVLSRPAGGNGTDLTLYLDGVAIATQGTGVNWDSATQFSLGQEYDGGSASDYWNGQMSDFKFFNTDLSAAQVKELYNNPEQAVPTGVDATSLVLHLPMTEGAGSYLYNANANAIGTELISNAGFDETCQKWGTTDSSTVEISGGKAIWTNAPLAGSFVEQPLDLEVGKFYRVKFDYTSTAFNIFVNVGNTQQAVPLGNGTFVYDMYYGAGTSSLKFKHGYSSGSSATVDNVSVKEVVPNYYNGSIVGATRVSGLPEPLPQTALMDWNKYQRWNGSQMVTIGSSTVQTVKHSFYARVTLEALNSDTNLGSIIFMNYSTTGTIISIRHDAQVQLRPHCSTNGSVNLLSGETVDLGRSYDIVGVIDGSYAKIYMDGILVASTAHTQTTTPGMGGVIGSWSSTQFGAAFDGIINQVAYFDRALTPEEIYKLYSNELKAQDISDCLHSWRNLNKWEDDKGVANGTLTGTPLYGLIQEGSTAGKDVFGNTISNPRASGAYNFDGASWAEVEDNASLDITDAITLECWFYWNDIVSKGIFGRWHQDSNDRNYLLWKSSDTRVDFYINGSSITQYYSLNSTKGWTHIVGVYDKNTARLYVDGVDVASSSHSLDITTSTMPLEIGRNFTTSNQAINSQLANPRVYNYALTAEQVADNFNEKASTFGGTKVASELDAYIERTASDGATVEAHSCLVNYLTELDKK